jgi:hypothetical protein
VLRESQLLPPFIRGQPSEGRQPKYERRAIGGKKSEGISGQPALLAYLRRNIRGKAAEASAQSHRCWLAAAFLMHRHH